MVYEHRGEESQSGSHSPLDSRPGGMGTAHRARIRAGPGTGTNPHIAGELFNLLGGVDMMVIQFKGGGPALVGLAGGEPGIGFPNISEVLPFVTAGRLRALAVTSENAQRHCRICRRWPKPVCRDMNSPPGTACSRQKAHRKK